jgi:hypothetical protein
VCTHSSRRLPRSGTSPASSTPSASPRARRHRRRSSVDLYGTALVLEEFADVIGPGGAGVVIASQSGHRLGALTAEEDAALATTPTDELLALPMLLPDRVTDSLHAYQLSKRGNALGDDELVLVSGRATTGTLLRLSALATPA